MSNSKKGNSTKPVEKFQLRGISASVFRNEGENGSTFYKASVTRTYKDGNDFKSTSSFGRDDLPLVADVAARAWRFILEQEAQESR